jgi:hypothetical protein
MAVMQISIGDNDITEQKKEETQQQLPKEEPKPINTVNTSNSSSNVNKFNMNFQPQLQQQPSSNMMPQTRSISGKNVSNLFGQPKNK